MSTVLRVVWKDSNPQTMKPIKYRGHYAKGYKGGWVIDIPGDDNIYASFYCAENAIDKALGGEPRIKNSKRIGYGIRVIGKVKEEETV